MPVNPLITAAHRLLRSMDVEYAFCGGFAIELFLDKEVRTHGDIDVSAWWDNRDEIISFMQELDWFCCTNQPIFCGKDINWTLMPQLPSWEGRGGHGSRPQSLP